jgi:hypothetical protein
MEVQVLGSGTEGGGGGFDSVARLAEKEDVTVPLPCIVARSCWKLSFKGMVKTPETRIVAEVVLSASRPSILNVAVPVVAEVFWKSNGDCAGVHTWPAAAGVAVQPDDPSIPGSRRVRVIEMFGATAKFIKSGTFIAPGGLVISSIEPVLPAKAEKPPCWELDGELMENWWLAPKAMPPVVRLTVPVMFRTPVIKDAWAVIGIIKNARKLMVFFKVPPSRSRAANLWAIMWRGFRKRR